MRTSDGKECSAFIVTKTDQIAPQITGMARELCCCDGVLILVFTSLGLSLWIYRGVIGPLETAEEGDAEHQRRKSGFYRGAVRCGRDQ